MCVCVCKDDRIISNTGGVSKQRTSVKNSLEAIVHLFLTGQVWRVLLEPLLLSYRSLADLLVNETNIYT